MLKRTLMGIIGMLVSTIIYADITFTSPPSGTTLTIGTNYQIQWSGPASEGSQTVTVYLATPNEAWIEMVSNSHTKADGGFTWEVGRLANGTLETTGGQYKMWLESDDGDSGEHSITLVEQSFTLDHPLNGETLTIGSNYQVQWHGPTYWANQLVTMFLEIPSQNWYQIVDDSHTKGQGGFTWEVGRLKNGILASPGQYRISLESLDGDYMGPTVTLVAGPSFEINKIREIFKKIHELKIQYVPGVCIVCFELELKTLKSKLLKIKNTYQLILYQGRRRVAKLGMFGGRSQLPNEAKIKLSKEQAKRLKRGGRDKYQLKVFTAKGKLIHTQKILEKLVKRPLLKVKRSKMRLK